MMAAPTEPPIDAFPDQGLKPLTALGAMLRLIRDPQDTSQVAVLEVALAGRAQRRVYERFVASPHGRRVIRERRSLLRVLGDHDYLRSLPENSLGRHYLQFALRERLSSDGLMAATRPMTDHLAHLPDSVRLFSDYTQRGAHDLHHVLGGYDRDELGEICVLAMAYSHLKIRAYKVIFRVGPFIVRKYLRRAGVSAEGVFAAVREAEAIGRAAVWLPGIDMEAALAEDLDQLRVRLNIARPRRYQAVVARLAAQTGWLHGPFAGIRAARSGP